jgi:hypothetical protein
MKIRSRGKVGIGRMGATAAEAESVVVAFIREMNEWERTAWRARRAARDTERPDSYLADAAASLQRLFGEFCTPRERPHGRLGSFQHPPEYEPDSERMVASRIEGRRAMVDTDREAALGAGRLRYTLHRRGDRWLIDNVKRLDGDTWYRASL